eukprot:COSAG06_NODE_4625_length_4089_cov_101.881203_3_plen_153_part_00
MDDEALTALPVYSGLTDVSIACTGWQDSKDIPSLAAEKRHVRYTLVIKRGRDSHTIQQKWSACQDLDTNCYGKLKSSKLPCKYKLRFPSKTRGAGFDKAELEARRSELNTYFNEFADWHNQVFDESQGKIDLMVGGNGCDPSRVIEKFFVRA